MKIKITVSIVIVVMVLLASILFINKIQHEKKIEPLITKQETLLHQGLVDILNGYDDYYNIQEISTTENNSTSNSTILTTQYNVKIGDKNFIDNISIDWNKENINVNDIFTEENKKNFIAMQSYAIQLSQEKAWNDLEERMISMSIELIKSQLVSPNNADFGGANLEKIYDNEDGSGYYQVKGKVTTMNSYGDKIKYNYVVSLNISKDLKNYEVVDFNIF